jgi:xanthosine utilization system XapX-like protein
VSLDNILWFLGIVAEAVVVALLLYRRTWRMLPVFCVSCVWVLLSDAGIYSVMRFYPNSYFSAYMVTMVVDSVLDFSVLVELAWSVLRPIRATLPPRSLPIVGLLIIVVGVAIWPFANHIAPLSFGSRFHLLMQMQETVSVLRLLLFLILASFSHLLALSFRDRELQVATGLGIYSLVSLAVVILQTHQSLATHYQQLNQVVVASYLCSLLYWVFSFAQKEAERREFTPQMQSILLAVAGVARSNRIAISDRSAANSRDRRER